MSHFAGIGHFLEHPHSADDSYLCSSRVDYRHSDPAYCHLEADSAPSGYSTDSWAPHSYHVRAITGPSSSRADYASWGADYRRDRGIHPQHSDLCSWAIILTSSSRHYLIICIVSFIDFLYVFPCYNRICNPMLLIFYILGLVVLLVFLYIVLSWSNTNLSLFDHC